MTIAYLLNIYPAPSGTFIRREIEALEERGTDIRRFAVRRFHAPLVDGRDRSEADRTTYLLEGALPDLLLCALREVFVNLPGVLRALPLWWRVLRNAGLGAFVRHVAYFLQAASFRQKTARAGIKHVHAHFGTNATTVAMLAHAMGGPAYSFTAHGSDEFVEAPTLSYGLKIENAAFVVAISDYCRKIVAGLCGRPEDVRKIHVARCGIWLDEFPPAPPVAQGNRTLVCVGRLCPQKGQVHIPAVVAALRADFPDLRVILAGDGETRAAVEAEIARHGVGDQVILHGWASNDEVRRLIAQARVFLLPSYAEGLPIVLMEALALGRTAITTTVAAIPELIDEDCGWLVAPGNEAELAAALRAALETPEEILAAMGRAGRARVARLHDVRDLAALLEPLFGVERRVKAETGRAKEEWQAQPELPMI